MSPRSRHPTAGAYFSSRSSSRFFFGGFFVTWAALATSLVGRGAGTSGTVACPPPVALLLFVVLARVPICVLFAFWDLGALVLPDFEGPAPPDSDGDPLGGALVVAAVAPDPIESPDAAGSTPPRVASATAPISTATMAIPIARGRRFPPGEGTISSHEASAVALAGAGAVRIG